jgi:hypothetical protein
MPGCSPRGGQTTQSGIYFQNSITVLRLADMLFQRQLPTLLSPSIISVTTEAPTEVDDTVLNWSTGKHEFIQTKSSFDPAGEE